jgi:hypothetical protein
MANQLDRSRFNVKGGGQIWAREIYPTPLASATFMNLGVMEGLELDSGQDSIQIFDGAGQLWDNQTSKQTAIITFNLSQSGIDEINFVLSGMFFEMYYPVLLSNGAYQELNAVLCKCEQAVKVPFKPGHRTIPVKMYMCVPKTATITRTGTIAANYSIANQAPFVLLQHASTPYGAPDDLATTVSTAVY